MSQHIIMKFWLYYLPSGRLREVKNKGKIKLLALKVVAVAEERWWLLLVVWKTRRRGEVVAASFSVENSSLRRGGRCFF